MLFPNNQPDRRRPPFPEKTILPDIEPCETFTMRCGLRVMLLHDPDAEGNRLEFIMPAGTSWHHNPLTASFAISLLREGTRNYTGPQLTGKLDYHGAFVELQASADYAWLTAYTHHSKTLPLVRYLTSMLKEPKFGQRPFNQHRKRQLVRFRTEMLRTRILAHRAFKSALYGPASAYGQLIDEENFVQLTPEDLNSFHQNRFSTETMVLIAAGKINPKCLEAIDNSLSSHRKPTTADNRQINKDQTSGVIVVEKADALQASIVMGRQVVGRQHPDFPALSLLNTILGGYFGSRLMTNLREDKGYTYGIHSQIAIQELAAHMTITADVGTSVTSEALKEIRYELDRLQEEHVGDEELNLVKNYLSGSYAQALDGVFSKAQRLRHLAPAGLDLDYYVALLENIWAIDSAQLKHVAQKYLNHKEMLTVIAGNKSALQMI